ncbi:MAG: AAA family ATPase [Myxococcales bacterium]|nr:AAA family ATPase [Myxococcales bacterium]
MQSPADPSPWTTGAVLADRYLIEDPIGEGGFGQVWRARQQGTDQTVAIKRLRLARGPGAPPPDRQRERFRREIRLCGRLFHPHIVRLVDAGETPTGELYTVFEYVPGRDLAAILAQEGRLSLQETLHLMTQVLDGLAAAHAAGVVHRDLKPHNIMVTETGARRNALILDFGTGALADGHGDGARITASLEVLGTPAYAAPEQLRGLPPTPRADLYAWGLIVIECLTGSRVIQGDSVHETLFRQLGDDPIEIPPALRGQPLGLLLERVLHKDVERRDVAAAELVRALEGLAAPAPRPRAPDADPADPALAPGEIATLDAPLDPATWHHATGDRRPLIALACHLTLEALPGRPADPEVLDALARRELAACAHDVTPTGARLAGALGADLVWYFGVPHAREDDGRRAARAARALHRGVAARAATLEQSYGVRLTARLGLHAGRQTLTAAAAAGPHPDALGLIAARALALAVAAEPGELAQSDAARRLVDGARGPDTLDAPRLSPLVGRDRELEALDALWQRARAGHGQAALLIGEAGIGKSRLTRELRDRIGAATWLETRCLPEARNSALRPLADLVEALIGLPDDAPAPARVDALHRLVLARELDPAEAMPLLGALAGLPLGDTWPQPPHPPARRRELTFDLLLQSLFHLAERRPLVLAIDDLHWADPSTLEFLKLLVEDLPTTPVLAILTARPGFDAPWSPGRVSPLRLDRLDPAAVEALIAACDATGALTGRLREQVAERTDGVPLFVEELTRMLADTHAARGDDAAVPATLQASLAARLDALGAARRTAQVAAVIGREFREDLLALVADRDPIALRADLRALIDATLVYRRRRARPTYVFKHALVRDTAYDALTGPARATLHARIGEAIEAHLPEEGIRRPELLAHHFGAAGDRRRATAYAERAAGDALRRSANVEAISHARQAIEWLDAIADEHERLQRELRLNGLMTPALMASKGFVAPEVRAALDRAGEIIDRLGDEPSALPHLWTTAVYRNVLGDRLEARALMDRIVQRAEHLEDKSTLIAALPMLAGYWMMEGEHPRALEHFDRAVALYDKTTHRGLGALYGWDPLATAEVGRAIAAYAIGRPDDALAMSARGVTWARETGHAGTVAQALMYRANLGLYAGERTLARDAAAEGTEHCRAHQLPDSLAYLEILRGWGADDIDACRAALAACQRTGLRLGMSVFPVALAELESRRGQHAEAIERLRACVAFAEDTGERFLLPWVTGHLGDALARQDPDDPAAAEAWQTAIDRADAMAAPMLALPATLSWARWTDRRGGRRRSIDALAARLGVIRGGEALSVVRDGRALLAELQHAPRPPGGGTP